MILLVCTTLAMNIIWHICNRNCYDMKYFTRLRVSAYNVKIETGWHSHPNTPAEWRMCRHCNKPENELNFFLICNKKQRSITVSQTFLNDIIEINLPFAGINVNEKFEYLMAEVDESVCELLLNTIYRWCWSVPASILGIVCQINHVSNTLFCAYCLAMYNKVQSKCLKVLEYL